MAYVWREGFLVGFRGRYSLIKTYAMSDKSNKRLTDLKRKKRISTSDLGAPLLG